MWPQRPRAGGATKKLTRKKSVAPQSGRRKRPARKSVLAVRPDNPRLRLIVTVSLVVVVVVAVVAAYLYGEHRGGYERLASTARHERLVQQRDTLIGKNVKLGQRVTFLKRSQVIDRHATQKVQQANTQLQSQVVELKKKLSFYTDIVAPGQVKSGVHVRALDVVSDGKPHHYRYNLVLLQAPRHSREMRGTVKVVVVSADNQPGVTLNRSFKFRYFENLRGSLQLPADFKPDRITVTVSPRGRSARRVSRSFEWQVTS